MKLLLTNDDGILASGLSAIEEGLRRAGHEVVVVAPDREQSATSHSITLDRPLRIRELQDGRYTVDGTPTDCVLVACHGILKEKPEAVVSGINHGPNLGEDVTYSGTVAAAFEAHILGMPAVAVSMMDREFGDYAAGADFVARLLPALLARAKGSRPLFNVNLPRGPQGDWEPARFTRLGTRKYADEIVEKEDPRGKKYYWIGGSEPTWSGGADTDSAAIAEGAPSITPLHLDLTDEVMFDELASWDLAETGR